MSREEITEMIDKEWTHTFEPLIKRIFEDLQTSNKQRLSERDDIMSAYSKCYKILTQKGIEYEHINDLSNRQRKILKDFCWSFTMTSIDDFLKCWKIYNLSLKFFKMFFYYHDRMYKNLYKTSNCFLSIFYYNYLYFNRDKLINLLIQCRLAETDRNQFCQTISAFTKLDETCNLMMFKYFEDFYISDVTFHYQKKSREWRLLNNIMLYMQKALDYLNHERETTHHFYLDRSWNITKGIFISEIIGSYSDTCMEDGAFIKTLRSGDKNNIRTHYEFLQHTHFTEIVDNYSTYIGECIGELPKDTSIIEVMIVMNNREHEYIDEIFSCHEKYIDFVEIIHKAWKNLLSKQSGLLSLFVRNIDKMIRNDDKDTDIKAANILAFFEYISDKDVFLQYYRDMMIHRLLDKYNADQEYIVIHILKTNMGGGYVLPLVSMMNDMNINNKYKYEFDPYTNKRTNAMVLSIQWGIKMDPTEWILPSCIDTELGDYISFFMTKYGRNKRLRTLHTLGQVIIKGIYNNKTYEFIMTPIQAMCFLAIGEGSNTMEEIADKVIKKGDKDIHNILTSLVKGGLLKAENNQWVINELYVSKRRINRIPAVDLKVSSEKNPEVVANRGYIIDGVIMRIMKSRRRLSHSDLIIDSGGQIKLFKPDVKDIKRRIESLLERDYLERDKENSSYYCYVA